MSEHKKCSRLSRQWNKLREALRDRDVTRIAPAAAVVITITVLVALFTVQGRSPQSTVPSRPTAPASPAPLFQYVMQTDPQDEHVLALFYAKEGELVRIASYPFAGENLPQADREILRQGLALRDSTELQSALEDYHPHVKWG